MSRQVFALLVGINDYAPEVGKLAGCLNDVDKLHAYLASSFSKAELAVETLKDSEATRDNIIRQFRGHLGKARQGDVALFQYCGHGARWASARQFREFYPDGKDEGLVCFDSRAKGGFDLADKELAVLIAQVTKNQPHMAVILDCCHSGSGTRGADAFRGLTPRLTHEVATERPLETYLGGYYAELQQKKMNLSIPAGRHILLAACERTELAQESADGQGKKGGVFTSTLVKVLEKSAAALSYADLFVRCRAAVRWRADNQNPQFEAFDNFNAHSGFLGCDPLVAARRYSVYFDLGSWKLDCGAIHGMPTEPHKTVALALYPENTQTRLAGNATTVQVGPQKSELKLDFASEEWVRYRAEITSLPHVPTPFYCPGDSAFKAALQTALEADGRVQVTLTDEEAGARYAVETENGNLLVKLCETGKTLQGVTLDALNPAGTAASMLPILKHLVQWERSLALQNPRTQMDPSLVDFIFAEQLQNGQEHVYTAHEVVLDFAKSGEKWREIRGKFKVRNRSGQTLHMVLAYFSSSYGIQILRNDPIEPAASDGAWVTLWGDEPKDYFYLKDTANESIDSFKLIVSTEKVDDFLLTQPGLVLGKILPATRTRSIGGDEDDAPSPKMQHQNEWFTKDCRVKVLRRLDQVGTLDSALAGGKITIKAHPSVKANLSMASAKQGARSAAGGADFWRAFERQGIEMVNFAGTRGDNESVLELTDIQNAASLKEHPLLIELRVPLNADEGILPLVFDGQHVLLGGEPYLDEEGTTHIRVDHIPQVQDGRRSLGGALKLYFFKTYLKQNRINQLRWVEFRPDGAVEHHDGGVAQKVAAAKNILLLVHGIIGDTEGMAQGVKDCGLDKVFDLVLAYDYENLSTPIMHTAQMLQAQLAELGFTAGGEKRLTLLAHSMGGLVSRWFIEREGGKHWVDHLVMCGTPNRGSPFGKIEDARRILGLLAGLSMNYVPALIPFSSAVLMVLNRSKKLTPALEQMHPSSDFITTLNASDDPGVRYSILAGDVNTYQEPSDPFFARMLAKAGQSFVFDALFAGQSNDIAVDVPSILGVDGPRKFAAQRKQLACHHLNYFSSASGQKALGEVQWSL